MTAWTTSKAKQVAPVRTNPRVCERERLRPEGQREAERNAGRKGGNAGRGGGGRERAHGVCSERDGRHARRVATAVSQDVLELKQR
jgi:hypothetical protein